ncbi:hypothetical protein [Modestobacter sp. Leaf380]|uniref:hypothetical protein n=1 Tax=Modestobacter sp. Leaf380 TaxID=1736356 RepID=UPI0012FCF9DC|nr:hypothetical protein [Modestobacter sp. Leaf380]
MSWSATVRRVLDADRPLGQRVAALHSLLANHHAPLGFLATRAALRSRVGATGRRWRETELLRALEHIEASRAAHLERVAEVAARRRVEKAAGRRQPSAADTRVLEEPRWTPAAAVIDIGAVLRQVVDEVFGPEVLRDHREPDRHTHQVVLTSADGARHAGLQVSDEVVEVWVFDDLDASAMSFEYDDVEAHKADAVRQMARAARAHLDGAFTIRHRRSLLRRRLRPVVEVHADGRVWTLRRAVFWR